MTRPVLIRTLATAEDLRIRSSERVVVGMAVPYDSPTEIAEEGHRYTEQFARGSFARTIRERGPERVKALALHDRQMLPVGRAQLLREERDGLHCELKISKTPRGDEILELVNDGVLDSLSVGFVPVSDDTSTRGLVIRTEVALREISLVPWPAYDLAKITGTRSAGTPVRNAARARQDALRARFSEYLT